MKQPTHKLSPSTLNLFQECKRCFYLQIKKNIKRPQTPFPSLPSGMDKILKTHFEKHAKNNTLPKELENLKNYKISNKPIIKEYQNNWKGIQYRYKDYLLRGAVDQILQKNKKLVVLDFKTRGFPLKENSHEYYKLQMDLYNFLLRKNGHKTQNYAYLLFYYPNKVDNKGNFVFDTRLVKIRTNVSRAERVFKDAIKCLEGSVPKVDKKCGFCCWGY